MKKIKFYQGDDLNFDWQNVFSVNSVFEFFCFLEEIIVGMVRNEESKIR